MVLMETEPKRSAESAGESLDEREATEFIERLESGEFDGHLFEEIRKLRSEHLARICRQLSRRKFEGKE